MFSWEQMKVIKKELGEDDNTEKAADEYMERLQNLTASGGSQREAYERDIQTSCIAADAAESGILTNYIETLLELPWENLQRE